MIGIRAKTEEELQNEYTKAMEDLMDTKAKSKGYDTRYTAALRTNSTVSKFKAEGQAYMEWMDNCYEIGYQILADVKAGTRTLPSIDNFLAELPELVW